MGTFRKSELFRFPSTESDLSVRGNTRLCLGNTFLPCFRWRFVPETSLSFYEVWGEVLPVAAAPCSSSLTGYNVVVQKNHLALSFGKCSTQLRIRLQKRGGNEQRRKSRKRDLAFPFQKRDGITLTWIFHVSAKRKHNGNMEFHVSAALQKYGITSYRPVYRRGQEKMMILSWCTTFEFSLQIHRPEFDKL